MQEISPSRRETMPSPAGTSEMVRVPSYISLRMSTERCESVRSMLICGKARMNSATSGIT